jgi:iron complex outermembrane recepter protein
LPLSTALKPHHAAALLLTALAVAIPHSEARAQDAEPAAPPAQAAVTPPEVASRVDAIYPAEALAARQEGSVVLFVSIGKDGNVTAATVAESAGEPFDQAALAAVKQWRFLPARRGDEPVASRIRVPFTFALPPPEAAPPPAPASAAPAIAAPPPNTATAPAAATPAPPPASTPAAPGETAPNAPPTEVTVRGRMIAPSRGASDYQLEVGGLATVPRKNAADVLKLAPGILLTNEGGDAHAEQVFLRGFDAREGQDIDFTVDGVPINESGNLHGNGYADVHFIIPELIESLRVVEGPFDPRQGNYAVAGSADYHLGLAQRGITAKASAGSYGTYRALLTYGPADGSQGTFAAAELYQTAGFGENRDGARGTAMFQYEGEGSGSTQYRVGASAYIASFHSAGVLRDDDYRAGRVGFYDTYDPLQGEDSSRYSLWGEVETHEGAITAKNQVFAIVRPLTIRENFTGFLLDVQEPLQNPHDQRGDLIEMHNQAETLGVRGSARASESVLGQPQELEVGYFARGDLVASTQQRIEAATGHPYHTDVDLDSTLGDLGLYVDANVRLRRWLALRGGVRADLFTYDINDKCAVQSVEHPLPSNPPGDQSCLSQEDFGAYREPNQRATTESSAYMPRGSLIVGPFAGVSASLSAGKGVRSIDPIYIAQDAKTPFATITAYEGGLTYDHRFSDGTNLGVRSALFDTRVDRDLIFSQTAGRNVLGGPTTRVGSANSARLTGAFYDVAANVTYVKATYDDTGLLIPYVPDLVVRVDNAFYGDLPWWQEKLGHHPIRASFSTGITYVGPRPLPYGSRSDTIFTIDNNLALGWRFAELGVSVQNLLNTKYRLGEYNYASDFHSQTFPTLVPVRHFSAGAPRIIMVSLSLNFGGAT